MWKVIGLDHEKQYRLALVQSGRRFVLPVEDGVAISVHGNYLLTDIVPFELLIERDPAHIADAVRLTSGEQFTLDAHGVWWTLKERSAMDAGFGWAHVPWIFGEAPQLPPK